MRCLNCGDELPERGAVCPGCGQPVFRVAVPVPDVPPVVRTPEPAETPEVRELPEPPEPAVRSAAPRAVVYAGFWLRLIAYLIDSAILSVPAAVLMMQFGPSLGMQIPPPLVPRDPAALHALYQLDFILLGVAWLYFALLESSPWQATPGKRLLGLVVTDVKGRRLTFTRASMRFFGKLLSSMTLLIGYVMAGFTARKQALHDILASCLVIRKV